MAIKGAQAKKDILEKMLMSFNGAFMNGEKELRIPWTENGETIEIKVTLTAAKDIIGNASVSFKTNSEIVKVENAMQNAIISSNNKVKEPTAEEKANLARLLQTFNL